MTTRLSVSLATYPSVYFCLFSCVYLYACMLHSEPVVCLFVCMSACMSACMDVFARITLSLKVGLYRQAPRRADCRSGRDGQTDKQINGQRSTSTYTYTPADRQRKEREDNKAAGRHTRKRIHTYRQTDRHIDGQMDRQNTHLCTHQPPILYSRSTG